MLARCVPTRSHPLCRPPKGLLKADIWRLPETGSWRKDNGDPGRAFVYVDKEGSATVWAANCTCDVFRWCPVALALSKALNLGSYTATVVRRRASRRRKINRVRRRSRR